MFSILCIVSPVYGSPFEAFFFDARAFPVDKDNDGGDDYILAQFDVDLDEDITVDVTVIVSLYNQAGGLVAKEQISYPVRGQEEGYTDLILVPSPNIEGAYYVHLSLSDSLDELYLYDVFYNPNPGNKPVAYFADASAFSTANGIEVELDVNIVQPTVCNVSVTAELISFAGAFIMSKTLDYETFFDNTDYKELDFTPPDESAYSIILMVTPGQGLPVTDSLILQALWPPGTGAYFSWYRAETVGDHIEVTFDVDLAYNISYTVAVEAILYNSNSDVAGYGYVSYRTNGLLKDEKLISLTPEPALTDTYYVELIVYVEADPAEFGYIEDVPYSVETKWDVNHDNVIDYLDLLILCKNFGKRGAQLENPSADLNNDGIVNVLDLVILSLHFREKSDW